MNTHGSLRIIFLEPAIDERTEIRGFLRNEVLSSLTTPFAALSYEWGTPGDRCLISVDNSRFYVQRNLRNFLVHVRRSSYTNIWIDAICVDQNNLQERGHQVRLMKDIYRQASKIPVYLGEHADGSDTALQYLNAWANAGRSRETNALQNLHRPIFSDVSELPLSKALSTLCVRTYWSRLWIVQEISMPQRKDVILHCGSSHVTLEDFDTLYLHVKAERSLWKQHTGKQTIPRGSLVDGSDNASTNFYRSLNERGQDDKSISRLIGDYKLSACSDPRDHMFGLLSLSTDGNLVDPDYTLSRLDTFLEVLCGRQGMEPPDPPSLLNYESTLWETFQLARSPQKLLDAISIHDVIAHLDSELAYHTPNSSRAILQPSTTLQPSMQKLDSVHAYKCRLALQDSTTARVTRVDAIPFNSGFQHYYQFECTYQQPRIIGGDNEPIPAYFASHYKPVLGDALLQIRTTSVGLLFRRLSAQAGATPARVDLNLDFGPDLYHYVGWAIPTCPHHCHDALRTVVMDARCSSHYLHSKLLRDVCILPLQTVSGSDVRFQVQVPASDIVHLVYSWSRDRTRRCRCFWSDSLAGYDDHQAAAEEAYKRQARS